MRLKLMPSSPTALFHAVKTMLDSDRALLCDTEIFCATQDISGLL